MVRYAVEFHHLSWMRSETWDLLGYEYICDMEKVKLFRKRK